MKKRVCIVINSLVQGGAQKSALLLAQELHQAEHHVRLLTFYPEETDFFKIPSGVQVERFIYPFQDNGRLKSGNRLSIRTQRILNRIKDFINLRKFFTEFRPDLVISFEASTSVLTYFANYNLCPQIISERVHPKFHEIPRWARILRPYVYKSKKTILHCQGNSIATWMRHEYQKDVFVIPNFLGEPTGGIWDENSRKVKIFSRYTHQKGIDLALIAWSLLPTELRREFSLEIFGDGDRSEYEKLVTKLKIGKSVKLNGATANVTQEMGDCLLYLMPSRFEGFPNALVESMGSGIPSLVTDSPSAIKDLTLDGKLAWLSKPSPEEISINIEFLLRNPTELEKLSSAGSLVRSYFKDTNTLSEWLDLITWVLDGCEFTLSKCRVCGGKLERKIANRTRGGLKRELLTMWEIEIDMLDMGSIPVVSASKCKKCKSINFSGPLGSSAFYDACHKSQKYSRALPWEYELQIADIFSKEKGIKILDFGGGISPFAKLRSSEIEITVIDLSLKVHEELRKFQVTTYSQLSQIPTGIKFDHINLSHTIEHVDDPIKLFNTLIRFLNPGGKIYVTTPDAISSHQLCSPLDWPPHHTYKFSPAALRKILKRSGLKNICLVRNPNKVDSSFDFMLSGEL